MHEVFSSVLNKRDLSRAGELFHMSDALILDDLTTTISKVIEITSQPDYSHNLNDQSVVEICITRITSAINQNTSVELEGLVLVSLLQTCLNHNLRPTTPNAAPPHAKIAAGIVGCIFLAYQQRSVMTVALPVAVKLLHKGNVELSRSISSYLSLAAIHSAPLLAQYTHTIVDSVIAGNYSLARILPGLYSEAQEPLHRHIMTLVSLLPRCHNPSDWRPLLQLFAQVAAHKPALLENSLPQLLDCLAQPATVLPTLQVVLLLAKWRPLLLTPYMSTLMTAVDSQPEALSLGLQVVCVLGRVSSEVARAALNYTAKHLASVEKSGLAEVLREVGGVVSQHPEAMTDELLRAVRECETATAHSTIQHMLSKQQQRCSTARECEPSSTHSSILHMLSNQQPQRSASSSNIRHSNSGGITIVTINSSNNITSPSSNNNICYTSNNSSSNGLEQLSSSSRQWSGAGLAGSRDRMASGRDTRLKDTASSTSRDLHSFREPLLMTKESRGDGAATSCSLYQQNPMAASRQHKYQKHGGGGGGMAGGAGGGCEAWRSTSRLVTSSNRSMPRLNTASGPGSGSSGRLGSSSIQLNKSLTRLNSSHHALTTMTRSITALSGPQQPARPLSTHFTASTTYASSPPSHSFVESGGGAAYTAFSPANYPPPLGGGTSAGAALLAATSGSSALPVTQAGYQIPSIPPSNKRFSSHLPGSGSGGGLSPAKSSVLHQAIQAVVSGPQRLTHVVSSGNGGSGQPTTNEGSSAPTSSSSPPPGPLPLLYPAGSAAHAAASVVAGKALAAAPTTSACTGTYSPLNSRDGLVYKVTEMVAEAEPHPVCSSSSPCKSKSSSATTLRDSCDSTAPATALDPGLQCSPFPPSSVTTSPITNTTNTTSLTTSSSGAVTSTSSGSVCDSAGSLTTTTTTTNNNSHHHNNNNHMSKSSSTLNSRSKQRRKHNSGGQNSSTAGCGGLVSPGTFSLVNSRTGGGGGGGIGSGDLGLEPAATVLRNATSSGTFSSGGVGGDQQRVSVFEPFAMKDTVQHFCEKHREKIKAYMQKVFVKLPLPVKCLIEERKRRKYAKLFFGCQGKGEHCLYNSQLFCIKVRHPRVWIHLMFLALQARSPSALSSRETQVSSLRHCWDTINGEVNVTFLTLVTSAFPSAKDMDTLMQDLRTNRFFDVFEYNGLEQQWGCFLCNHPDKAQGFVQEDTPVIEGQLKEKKSKWKFFRKWRTRYFTLSGAHLSYRGEHEDRVEEKGDIDVQQIRSVKVSKAGRRIPKAFEIFTDNKSFVLKAKDSSNAEEWVRCLSIVVAQQHVRDKSSSGSHSGPLYSSHSMPLHHHHNHHHSAPSHRANRASTASAGVCSSSSSSSVWPGYSGRVSSNTSLPRSLLYSPHGAASSPPPPPLSAAAPHPLQHSMTAGGGSSSSPAPALAALPALLSQHAGSHVPGSLHVASTSNTLPPGLHFVRSNV